MHFVTFKKDTEINENTIIPSGTVVEIEMKLPKSDYTTVIYKDKSYTFMDYVFVEEDDLKGLTKFS